MQNSEVFRDLYRARYVLALVALGAGLVGYLWSFTVKPRYRAETKTVFVQDRGNSPLGNLGAMAGAFGFRVGQGADRLALNAEYVLSHDLLVELVQENWPLEGDARISLLEQWGEGDSKQERLLSAVERFRSYLQVETLADAGVLRITVETFAPELSVHIARRFIIKLNEFNASLRRWSGSNRIETLASRLTDVRRDLQAAEDSLMVFRMANLDLSHPRLQLDEMRFLREVALQTEILQSIRVELEMARLEAVSDEPVLKVLQTPYPSSEPAWPRRYRIAGLVGFAALVFGCYIVVAIAGVRRIRTSG